MAWNEPGPGGRDPWSQGPKRPDGPPDLDAMFKKLRDRFSNKRGTGGGKATGGLAAGVIVLLGVLWIGSGFYVVDEQERAVVLRFGKNIGTTDPGLHWHLPWPVEREEVVNVTGVRSARDRATMLTQDENLVDLELTVQYRVSSIEDYVFNVEDPDQTMRQATKASVREVVGQSKMDFILTDGRQEIADHTKRLLQERMEEYATGLVVTEVNLQQAQPPEPVQAAFADAIKAREDQQRLKNEAEAYSNERLPRARGAVARQIAEATAYRDQIVSKAEGDAARFDQLYAEYRKAPQVMRDRMYLDAMAEVYGNSSKVLLDVEGGNQMMYLPLDQMLRAGATGKADNTSPGLPDLVPGSSGMGGSNTEDARSRARSR